MKKVVAFILVSLLLLLVYYFQNRAVKCTLVYLFPMEGAATVQRESDYLNDPDCVPWCVSRLNLDFTHYDYVVSYGWRVKRLMHDRFFSQGFTDPPAKAVTPPMVPQFVGERCDTVFVYRVPLNAHYRPADQTYVAAQ